MAKPVAGFDTNPQNINKAGRPKRKTLTELIHKKLDETPDGWDKLATMVLVKIFKESDRDILKTLWAHTDGMPKQKTEITGEDGDAVKIDISSALDKAYGSTKPKDNSRVHSDS